MSELQTYDYVLRHLPPDHHEWATKHLAEEALAGEETTPLPVDEALEFLADCADEAYGDAEAAVGDAEAAYRNAVAESNDAHARREAICHALEMLPD
jgi:hypothetical protein